MGLVSLTEDWCTACKYNGDRRRKTVHGDAGKAAVLGEVVSHGGKMCQHRRLCVEYESLLAEGDGDNLRTKDALGICAVVPSKPSALTLTRLESSCTSGAHIPSTVLLLNSGLPLPSCARLAYLHPHRLVYTKSATQTCSPSSVSASQTWELYRLLRSVGDDGRFIQAQGNDWPALETIVYLSCSA